MALIDQFLDDRLRAKMEDPDEVDYMSVIVPGDLDPFDRHFRFSVRALACPRQAKIVFGEHNLAQTQIDAELRLMGLGCSLGGGTLFSDEDDDGESEILFSVCDVDATDVDGARALLRLHLPELGCTERTLIQYCED